jgi:hypothetical protein
MKLFEKVRIFCVRVQKVLILMVLGEIALRQSLYIKKV